MTGRLLLEKTGQATPAAAGIVIAVVAGICLLPFIMAVIFACCCTCCGIKGCATQLRACLCTKDPRSRAATAMI